MKRIIIVGKACSGKDHLRNAFHTLGHRVDVSVTTRSPREGEVDGFTYHFLSKNTFEAFYKLKQLYEHVEFNGNCYGTLKTSWIESEVFIMTPSGVECITPEDRENCCIVHLDVSESVRRERLLKRGDSAEKVARRLAADDAEFAEFTDFDIEIDDPNFDALWLVKRATQTGSATSPRPPKRVRTSHESAAVPAP